MMQNKNYINITMYFKCCRCEVQSVTSYPIANLL